MNQVPEERGTEPLNGFRLFRTRDIDRARHSVARKFCAHQLRPEGRTDDFDALHNHAAGQSLSLNYLQYGSDVSIDPGELDSFYLVQLPLSGTAEVTNGRSQVAATTRTGTVLNPTRGTRMTWHAGCRKLLLKIDRDALNRMAETLTGLALGHAVVFDTRVDLGAPEVQSWRRALLAAVSVAENGGAFGANVHRHQALLEEELICGFLAAHRSTISHMLEAACARPSTAQVRQAQVYIHDNLAEPITLSDIAGAAGCSLRSLQLGFQREFGCSPMRYLAQQRMNYAHFLLQTVPPETRVGAVAFEAGFSHLGRFATAYRQSFGQSPRETLMHRQA